MRLPREAARARAARKIPSEPLNFWERGSADRTALDICKFSKKGGLCVCSKNFLEAFLPLSADCWVMKSMKFAHICW